MDAKKFKELASKAPTADMIDALCLDWLRSAANEYPERERDMMHAGLAVVAKGLE